MSLEEAKDPNTKPARLVELSQEQDQKILVALAQNPSTPLDTLLVLAQRYPADFLANPVLPVLLLENPNVLHGCSYEAAKALVELPESPSWVLHSLALHPEQDLRQHVASNKTTSIAILEALSRDADGGVRRSVATNGNTPLAILEVLARDFDKYVCRGVAENETTSIAILEALSRDVDKDVRRNVAGNDNVPIRLLEVLSYLDKLTSQC